MITVRSGPQNPETSTWAQGFVDAFPVVVCLVVNGEVAVLVATLTEKLPLFVPASR